MRLDHILHQRLEAWLSRERRQDLTNPADDLRGAKHELASGRCDLHLMVLARCRVAEAAGDGEGTPAYRQGPGARLGAEMVLNMLRISVELPKYCQ